MRKFGTIVTLLLCTAMAAPKETPPPSINMATNGDFEKGTSAPKGWDKPDGKRVRWGKGFGKEGSRGLRIEMDQEIAFGYGQGHFSSPIPVEPRTEYRVSVDVRSDNPNAIIFIKGYAKVRGTLREVYSKHKEAHFDRYLAKEVGSGQFVHQSFTFHPRHGTYQVEHIKVWLYGYLKPGVLDFDNVRVERVGKAEVPAAEKRSTKKPVRAPSTNNSKPIYLDPKDF